MRAGEGAYAGGAGRIHYRWWSAPDPRWVVMLAHGFGDHSQRWERYGTALAGWGGAVFACDHRGHGRSEGERVAIADYDDVAREYLALHEVPEFPTGAPVVLHGHSMGGLIVARAALGGDVSFPLAGLVASSARLGGWAAAEAVLECAGRGESLPEPARGDPLLDPQAQLAPDALSRDPDIVARFKDDPLAYKGIFPLATLAAYVEGQRRVAAAGDGALDLPVLYLHGSEDPVFSPRGSVEALARLVPHDLEVRVFPHARHSIYNEINRDEVLAVLRAFLERVAQGDRTRPPAVEPGGEREDSFGVLFAVEVDELDPAVTFDPGLGTCPPTSSP